MKGARVVVSICLVTSSALVGGCKTGGASNLDGGAEGGADSLSPLAAGDSAAAAPAPEVLKSHDEPHAAFPPRTPAKAGETVSVPAGKLFAGSTPGDPGRDPGSEPAEVPVDLGAFSIDALPYPNDPAQPPRTGVTRAAAASACGERGARLCSELEWERACKGTVASAAPSPPGADAFTTGAAWNPECDREPATCAGSSGARAMGATREWTSGDDQRGEGHRCAARTPVSAPDRSDFSATFRCCHGPATAATVPEPETHVPFRKPKLEAADVAAIFAKVPELSRLAQDVHFYDPGDANGIVNRSSGSHENIVFTVAPVIWAPEPGAELLVVVGHGKSSGFIVALYPLAGGTYRLASSFVLQNDLSPVALAYDPHHRKELIWTSCWSCAGEQGHVSLRDDHRIVIVQD